MSEKRNIVQTELLKALGSFNGKVILPENAEYDKSRALYYGWIDRRPAAIVRVADAQDVSRLITLARENGVRLAVRGGGHSAAGHSVVDDGIVLDLSGMNKLDIDVKNRTAWAEAGLTTGQYTVATGEHGLATGFGDAGSVGLGGITLGGGVGFLVRKHGLTIDSLLEAEIVTADGKLLRVNYETNPDLFWAIRGGGGNFGVATRFKFQLHDVGNVLGGILILPATAEVIQSFIALAEAAPEELSVIVNIMTAPPMPFIPQEYHGKPVVMAMMVYTGAVEAGERVVAPFRALAKPIADMVRPMRYPQMYEGEGPHPTAASFRNMFIDRVDRRTAEAIMDNLKASKASMAVAQLRVLGGAMARVPNDATAFAYRTRKIMVNVACLYERPQDSPQHDEWVKRFSSALDQGNAGVYVNFLGDEGEARIREAYPGRTWERLAEVKDKYDPTNFFRLNQNIQPADGQVKNVS
ncbi:MAG: FAD-binding oxidoreductase [Ignavibacteriae bacterium]|nr:FAD-binding oxidoreductase [Ignavibacteriota bacterium]